MTTQAILDVAGVAGLITLLVQVFVLPWIPAGPKQNAEIRGIATVLGAILVPLATLTAPGAHLSLYGLEAAVAQGIALGGGLTFGIAAVKTGIKTLPAVSVSKPTDPAPPAA